ncbi:MAG: tRNA lysidine(34) synthetase TilS [Crocinitomicaceae bacterium]
MLTTSLESHFKSIAEKLKNKKVYLALSGGVDSMVLLHLCKQMDINIYALHCNFKLRGEDSKLDSDFVQSFCQSNNIPIDTAEFNTSKIAKDKKETVQVCARNLRYTWFNSFLQKDSNSILFTAHHANDSIETFFINVLRGTGIKGLTGIQEERKQILRPLISFSKSTIKSYAVAHDIPFREDKSNLETKYTRNKVRHTVIPLMESMTDQFDEKMQILMQDLKGIDSFLTSQVNNLKSRIIKSEDGEDSIAIDQLRMLEYPILARLLETYNVQRIQVKEIEKLLNSQAGAIFQNNNFTFLKNRSAILIKNRTERTVIEEFVKSYPWEQSLNGKRISFSKIKNANIQFNPQSAFLDFSKIKSTLKITNSFSGMRMQPLGMKGSKLLSDILIDAKTNRFEKENQLAVLDGAEVVWLVGKTVNQKYAITGETNTILKIEILE